MRTVVAVSVSPTLMRLYACHRSSGTSGRSVTLPSPSLARTALVTSFMVRNVRQLHTKRKQRKAVLYRCERRVPRN